MNLLARYGIVKAMPAADRAPDRDSPVRQRSLRTHNLGLVLRHVAACLQPVSRADVAAATGLTKATVSTLVDELLAGDLLVETDPPPRSGAGRPGVGLRLASHGPAGLGLEVNVDYLAASVVDLTGSVRHHQVLSADLRGRPPTRVLADLTALASAAVTAVADEGLRVAGATVAVAGLVADGVVRLGPNLDWHEVPVRSILREGFAAGGLDAIAGSVTVENEANVAALGELGAWAEADPTAERASFLYISGEIGVGAGIVLDGRLFRGARGFGGELGHVTIRPDGLLCRCGARGCLEAYANQEALLQRAGLGQPGPAGAVDRLVALADAGVPDALAAVEEAGTALGVAAATVVNLIDVDTVVLGGIYAPLSAWLCGPVEREIADRVLTAQWAPVAVRPSMLGASATVVGAAGSVVRTIRDSPTGWLTAGVS
jgi:predicted NBD/HSP70 family sugar kinase